LADAIDCGQVRAAPAAMGGVILQNCGGRQNSRGERHEKRKRKQEEGKKARRSA